MNVLVKDDSGDGLFMVLYKVSSYYISPSLPLKVLTQRTMLKVNQVHYGLMVP